VNRCRVDGKLFEQPATGRRRETCSDRCRQILCRRRRRAGFAWRLTEDAERRFGAALRSLPSELSDDIEPASLEVLRESEAVGIIERVPLAVVA
jgi:hypothetical protein